MPHDEYDIEDVRKAILAIVEDKIPLNSAWCKVKDVDTDKKTCSIILDDDDSLVLPDILLGYDKSGAVIIPVAGYDVLVQFVNNSRTIGYVIGCEKTAGVEIFGKNYKGIPMVEPLVQAIAAIQNDINSLKSALYQSLYTIPPLPEPGMNAPSALQALMGVKLMTYLNSSLTVTTVNDIQNDKVQHGNGQ